MVCLAYTFPQSATTGQVWQTIGRLGRLSVVSITQSSDTKLSFSPNALWGQSHVFPFPGGLSYTCSDNSQVIVPQPDLRFRYTINSLYMGCLKYITPKESVLVQPAVCQSIGPSVCMSVTMTVSVCVCVCSWFMEAIS